MSDKRSSKRWYKLDNAAKIYPAARRRTWTAIFRLSATLSEPVDADLLRAAQRRVLARFPTFAIRLRRGLFWYYLEQNDGEPDIQKDVANPCAPMDLRANRGFLFRIRYHGRRIAVEFFHALSDGTGGLVFLKTLVAEYLGLKHGAVIPRGDGILDCGEAPAHDELEDAYIKYARGVPMSRKEPNSFFLDGQNEKNGSINMITGMIPTENVLSLARELGVTLTEYLAAVMISALDGIQRSRKRRRGKLSPVKICIPINLRRFYPTRTLRNFASYVNPGIDPNLGEYTVPEIARIVHHQMQLEVSEKKLNAKISTNVNSENNRLLRIAPLFLKNAAMKLVFNMVGDRKTSSTISNLGNVTLPPEMEKYVDRLDFIIGPLSRNPVVCAALSYNGILYLNFTRDIRESVLEREFFKILVREGIPVKVESNALSIDKEASS